MKRKKYKYLVATRDEDSPLYYTSPTPAVGTHIYSLEAISKCNTFNSGWAPECSSCNKKNYTIGVKHYTQGLRTKQLVMICGSPEYQIKLARTLLEAQILAYY